jgi:hypothetical protein
MDMGICTWSGNVAWFSDYDAVTLRFSLRAPRIPREIV